MYELSRVHGFCTSSFSLEVWLHHNVYMYLIIPTSLIHILFRIAIPTLCTSLITLRACTKGKVIGHVIVVVVVADTKFTKSGDLGT